MERQKMQIILDFFSCFLTSDRAFRLATQAADAAFFETAGKKGDRCLFTSNVLTLPARKSPQNLQVSVFRNFQR